MNEDLGQMLDLVVAIHDAARAATDERIAQHLRESADRMSELVEKYRAPIDNT